MKELAKVKAYLEGKKSYIVGILSAFDGLYQYFVQHHSSVEQLFVYLLFGGGLAAIRAAISKA